jgi:hypothetical protein
MARNFAVSNKNSNENNGSRQSQKGRKPAPTARSGKGQKKPETGDLRQFIDSLGLHVNGSIRLNGPAHPTAVLTVDFGSPLQSVRLSPEQGQELTRRMRAVAREFYKDEVNVRVSADHQNGVYWASVT